MKTEGKDCENVDRTRLANYSSSAVNTVLYLRPPYQAWEVSE